VFLQRAWGQAQELGRFVSREIAGCNVLDWFAGHGGGFYRAAEGLSRAAALTVSLVGS